MEVARVVLRDSQLKGDIDRPLFADNIEESRFAKKKSERDALYDAAGAVNHQFGAG